MAADRGRPVGRARSNGIKSALRLPLQFPGAAPSQSSSIRSSYCRSRYCRSRLMARVVVDRSGIEFREIGPWFEMAASQSGQRVHLRSWLRCGGTPPARSEEHTSELQSLMRISYAVFCLKKKNKQQQTQPQLT